MKKCLQCNQTYVDDELNFCIDDGAVLSASFDAEVRQVLPQAGNFAPPTQMPVKSQAQSKNGFNYNYVIILILAILLTGSAVALFYERGKETANQNTKQIETPSEAKPDNQKQEALNFPNQSSPTKPNQDRFTVTDCKSIKDQQTNLEWFVGPDRNITWYEAMEWTASLDNCGGGWRMPSIREIQTLYNPAWTAGTGYFTGGRYFPAHIHPVFKAIGGGSWVWSDVQNNSNARSFNLNQGKAVEYPATNTTYSTRAFAVKN